MAGGWGLGGGGGGGVVCRFYCWTTQTGFGFSFPCGFPAAKQLGGSLQIDETSPGLSFRNSPKWRTVFPWGFLVVSQFLFWLGDPSNRLCTLCRCPLTGGLGCCFGFEPMVLVSSGQVARLGNCGLSNSTGAMRGPFGPKGTCFEARPTGPTDLHSSHTEPHRIPVWTIFLYRWPCFSVGSMDPWVPWVSPPPGLRREPGLFPRPGPCWWWWARSASSR